ncbi:MAG: hypothetical protein AAF242_10905 [Bacteroidota bacterium]
MDKQDFFSSVDTERKAQTDAFISHMKRPKEQMEDLDFSIPDMEEHSPIEKPKEENGDNINLEYSSEQLWSAELALLKFDEFLAWFLSVWSGQSPDKYRRRKVAASKDDREVQLLAAIINKYQMSMSIEAAFLSIFIMGYSPVFLSAYQDSQKVRNKKKEKPIEKPVEK